MKSKTVIDKHRFILVYPLGFVIPCGIQFALSLFLQVLIFFSILALLTLSDFDLLQGLPNAGDAGDADSNPGLGKPHGEGNSNLLQYSCLRNPMDRGARWAIVHGVEKSWT